MAIRNRIFWDDLRFPAVGINPTGAPGSASVDQDTGLLDFAASGQTVISIQAQLPHAWVQGSAIEPHVHWQKKTAGAGAVKWQFEYKIANVNSAFPASFTTLSTTSVVGDGDDGTALKHLISSFGDIDMTDRTISCFIIVKISRMGSDAADTYGGVAQLIGFDFHIQTDQPGSVQRYRR